MRRPETKNFYFNLIFVIFRAYPSLKMKVNINDSRSEVDVVLPGLRFDDIDHTGQENFRRNHFLNIQTKRRRSDPVL